MQATNFTASNGEYRNPMYEGQHEGETPEQAKLRLHWATAMRDVSAAQLVGQFVSGREAPTYQFQGREIGEGGWEACDLNRDLECRRRPEMDTHVVLVGRPSTGTVAGLCDLLGAEGVAP